MCRWGVGEQGGRAGRDGGGDATAKLTDTSTLLFRSQADFSQSRHSRELSAITNLILMTHPSWPCNLLTLSVTLRQRYTLLFTRFDRPTKCARGEGLTVKEDQL